MLLESRFLIMVMSWENRGVASSFLQGGSKYSKMLATTVGWWKKFGDAELLKRYISDLFQWDFTYSNLSYLAAEVFCIP